VNSWPTIAIPPNEFPFPPLVLKNTWGSSVNRPEFNSYVCGITPYDATHLGHAATYLTFDLIHRYQILRGRTLNFVENVTDVDDPLLERANRDGIDWKSLAESQVALFQKDMTALHILPPNLYVPVTETIDLVIAGMQKLKSKELVYALDGDLYYDISSRLKSLPIPIDEALKIFAERGGDPGRPGKRHQLDPLLWRKNIPGEPGWNSPFGFGRPGWHIECSVIALHGSTSLSGPVLDMQGGGSDLIFPHHFMSKIIAEDISGRDFAAEYVHSGMLGLDGEKMSKSRGNLVFVHKLLEEEVDPMAIRYALMRDRYSSDRMWSSELLDTATSEIEEIRQALAKMEVAPTSSVIEEIIRALADDLDTSAALKILLKWSRDSINGAIGGNAGVMARFLDSALGLAL
jgi:L-cysteine:1D-myo-inositol 2-amino-2-deoxy-alpha-D-glucopyranoside ligase